jgi:hypothetical protein
MLTYANACHDACRPVAERVMLMLQAVEMMEEVMAA